MFDPSIPAADTTLKRPTVLGVVLGASVCAAGCLLLFLMSLVPSMPLRVFFGASGEGSLLRRLGFGALGVWNMDSVYGLRNEAFRPSTANRLATLAAGLLFLVAVPSITIVVVRSVRRLAVTSNRARAAVAVAGIGTVLLALWGLQKLAFFAARPPDSSTRLTGPSFGALLILVGLLWLAGSIAQRRLPATIAARAATLVAAALTSATLVAGLAAMLRFTPSAVDPRGFIDSYPQWSFDPGVLFFSALLLTLVVGAFTFGTVQLLREPLHGALRRSALLVGVCFVVAGVVFPAFVIASPVTGADDFADFALASQWSAAVGGLSIPAALQAPLTLSTLSDTPFVSPSEARSTPFHWFKLAMATSGLREDGRTSRSAASFGRELGWWGPPVSLLITVTFTLALIASTVGLCRRAAVSQTWEGLRLGLLQGGCVSLLMTLTAILAAFSQTDARHQGPLGTYWGPSAVTLIWSVAVLLIVCGAAGLAYGTRRGRLAAATVVSSGDPAGQAEG